jgi:hypothetical protein
VWANYDWYMERILPVCEEANVRMALHPDDPPVECPLGDIARLFRNFANFQRAGATAAAPGLPATSKHQSTRSMRWRDGAGRNSVRHADKRRRSDRALAIE